MKDIKIEKVVLNIGSGADPKEIKKAVALLTAISGMKAVETKAKKRIATWKIRPGLPIGSKVTIRKKPAEELLKRLLKVIEKMSKKNFTENGFSFGIKEYIDIPEVKYDPKIGIIGLEVCVTLERIGFRVKRRRLKTAKISGAHKITKDDAIKFAQDKLGVNVE